MEKEFNPSGAVKPDALKGLVRVFGKNMLAGPLFESNDAQTIVMCDENGDPCVILTRMIDNQWAMGTCADEDWEAVKQRFGVK